MGALVDLQPPGAATEEPAATAQSQPASNQPPAANQPASQGQPATHPDGAADAQLQAGIQARYAQETSFQVPGSPNNPMTAAQSSAASPAAAQQAALQTSTPASAGTQNATQAVLVPFQLPQMANPIMLKIEQQEEDEDRSSEDADKRAWTVNLSLDAGPLGLVHIGIGLFQGAVSVNSPPPPHKARPHSALGCPSLGRASTGLALFPASFRLCRLSPRSRAGLSRSYAI